jgi:hypothetical protein
MSRSEPSESREERVRGVPRESGRVKSSASVPTCEFWALFKSVLQTNRLEGSAGNLRFATLSPTSYASAAFGSTNLPIQFLLMRVIQQKRIRTRKFHSRYFVQMRLPGITIVAMWKLLFFEMMPSIYICSSELRIILRIAFHISSDLHWIAI